MSFATTAQLSTSSARVLVEIDIGSISTQWVNNGAGLWAVNAENIYSWVDTTLLEEGFSAQEFGVIGSVRRDAILLERRAAPFSGTYSTDTFYYDIAGRMLWVCLENFDEPSLHTIIIGVTQGLSYNEFTPPDSPIPYEGRLLDVSDITLARDPFFFGLLAFGGGSVRIANADGFFDTLAEDYELYGNIVRVWAGYEDLSYNDYQLLYTGMLESFRVDHLTAEIDVADLRKSLTIPARFGFSNSVDPVTAIMLLLEHYYGYPTWSSQIYDWAGMAPTYSKSLAWKVMYQRDNSAPEAERKSLPLIDYIEQICLSGFVLLFYAPDGRISANVVDYDATVGSVLIRADDILNDYQVVYDPTEVISSVKVGYDFNWTTTETVYQHIRNTDSESAVFARYGVYNEHEVDTALETSTLADDWSDAFMAIHGKVRAAVSVTVPIAYYNIDIGDIVEVELERPSAEFIGNKLCEVVGKAIKLRDVPQVTYDLRFL